MGLQTYDKFVPFAKVAPHKREVTGVLTQEIPDHDGEIMDYASSKPYYMAWSNMVHQDTAGKSRGNLRVMHQNKVAGKLTNIEFDDALKRVLITAKVVDDQEWKNVLEGLYSGFSAGGAYVDKWDDDRVLPNGKNAVRFTADPYEASLVDRPSVSTATFSELKMIKWVKEDGQEEDIPLSDLAKAVESSDPVDKLINALTKRIARRTDVKPESGTEQYGDVEFADPTNKKYPIDTEEHIRAAWNYINKESDASKYSPAEVSEIKSKIIAAWKRKIDAKGPPSARGRKSINPTMAKGLYRAGELVQCIESLAAFAQGQVAEDRIEQQTGQDSKPSKLPKKVVATIQQLIPVLQQYIEEESEELLQSVTQATEAQKMSGVSGSAGDSLARFEAVTKGVGDLVDLLKAASKRDDGDDEEKSRKAREDEDESEKGISDEEKEARKRRNMKRAEKAKKARDADEDEDEHDKSASEEERKARKRRNEKRAEKRKAEEEKRAKAAAGGEMKGGEQPSPGQSTNAGSKAAGGEGVDLLLKAVGDLTSVVKEHMDKSAQEMDTLKGVILMQANEIQNLQGKVQKTRAPLFAANTPDDRFTSAYLKAAGKTPGGGEGNFSDMMKGVYAQSRGEA